MFDDGPKVGERRRPEHVVVPQRVPIRRREVQRVGRTSSVQQDLITRLIDGAAPAVAVRTVGHSEPRVDLAVIRGAQLIAERPSRGVGIVHVRQRVRPRRHDLGLEGLHRPEPRHLADALQVVLERNDADHEELPLVVLAHLDRAAVPSVEDRLDGEPARRRHIRIGAVDQDAATAPGREGVAGEDPRIGRPSCRGWHGRQEKGDDRHPYRADTHTRHANRCLRTGKGGAVFERGQGAGTISGARPRARSPNRARAIKTSPGSQ